MTQKRSLVWRLARAVLAVALVLALAVAGLAVADLAIPPVSTLMLARELRGQPVTRIVTPLERIAPRLVASVVMSEDGQFCRHHGVDWAALNDVMEDAGEDGPSRGASTITMQTAKNMFLWPGRSTVRKALEIPLALGLDRLWGKRRTLEIYLNIAEWGDGIFGAEAAARRYFGKSAADLDAREAALLATALPNPFRRNPARPSRAHQALARLNMARAENAAPWLDCLARE